MQRPELLRTTAGEGVYCIYREFEYQLDVWEQRDAPRPDRGTSRLALLALEREANVAVAYSPAVLGPRLAALRISSAVRDLVRRALFSIWTDEQMHVISVRAALTELGRPLMPVRTLSYQAAGVVGGWTVAVRQHRRWRQAPVARTAATLITWVGACTGRVPRTVRPHIDYRSFRDFCRYNVETERTAWLCWDRLTRLAAHARQLSAGRPEEFRRIAEDEDRHRRIFALLGDVLDANDELCASCTADDLSARLATASAPRPTTAHNDAAGRTSTMPHRIDRSCWA